MKNKIIIILLSLLVICYIFINYQTKQNKFISEQNKDLENKIILITSQNKKNLFDLNERNKELKKQNDKNIKIQNEIEKISKSFSKNNCANFFIDDNIIRLLQKNKIY